MYSDQWHPLYGKDTECHKCGGPAVWVFNGDSVGNYHYCRNCKVETGPFARDIELPKLEVKDKTFRELLEELDKLYTDPMDKAVQAALDTQDRLDQLPFFFNAYTPGIVSAVDLCIDEEWGYGGE